MELDYYDKVKKIEIASDLLTYARLMEAMIKDPSVLIKNICRKYDVNIDEKQFVRIKNHHRYNGIVTIFSYIEEEYFDKLKLKTLGIDESELENIFINHADLNYFKNHNPGYNNQIQYVKILKTIRNALNHTENGPLYKYIEDQDAIEINMKNVGLSDDGKPIPFHVVIKLNFLVRIINQIRATGLVKSHFVLSTGNTNFDSNNFYNELKENAKITRIISSNNSDYEERLKEIRDSNENGSKLLNDWMDEGTIKVRKYCYNNKTLPEVLINSLAEINSSYESDPRIEVAFRNINIINLLACGSMIHEDAKKIMAKFFSTRNIFPIGIISSSRYISSLLFEQFALKSWNYSYYRILKNEFKNPIIDLKKLNSYEYFLIDPLEKIYTEYESFIRFAMINFTVLDNDLSKATFIKYNGKDYNLTFLRNAFAHGRVGFIKNNGKYVFALFDTPNGLRNETNYYDEGDFKPQLFTGEELTKLSMKLYLDEKKKLVNNRELDNSFVNDYFVPSEYYSGPKK